MQKQQLEKFIDTVKVAEQSNKKEIRMSINDARNLSVALTKMLMDYVSVLETQVKIIEHYHNVAVTDDSTEMDGGNF